MMLKDIVTFLNSRVEAGEFALSDANAIRALTDYVEHDAPTPEAYRDARDRNLQDADEIARLKGDLDGARNALEQHKRLLEAEKGVRQHREQQLGAIMLICGK